MLQLDFSYASYYTLFIPPSIALLAAWMYYDFSSPKLKSLNVPSIDGKEGPYGVEFCSAIEEGTTKVGNLLLSSSSTD